MPLPQTIGCAQFAGDDCMRMIAMRVRVHVLLIASAVVLGGCVSAEYEAALKDRKAAATQCRRQYEVPRNAVKLSQCLTEAEQSIMPYTDDPDIERTFQAQRLAIAEKYQRGQFSKAEAEALLAKARSDANTEEDLRETRRRSVRAQEAAARAAAEPVTCATSLGIITCH